MPMTMRDTSSRPDHGRAATPGTGDHVTRSAVAEAASLLVASRADTTRRERRRQARLARIVHDDAARELTFALTDEVLRIDDPRRSATRFTAVVRDHGAVPGLGHLDRIALSVGATLATRLPPRLPRRSPSASPSPTRSGLPMPPPVSRSPSPAPPSSIPAS